MVVLAQVLVEDAGKYKALKTITVLALTLLVAGGGAYSRAPEILRSTRPIFKNQTLVDSP